MGTQHATAAVKSIVVSNAAMASPVPQTTIFASPTLACLEFDLYGANVRPVENAEENARNEWKLQKYIKKRCVKDEDVEGSGDIANCIYCPWKYVEKSKLMNALPSMAGERMGTDEAGNLYLPSSCEYLRGHSGEILTYLCTQMDCPNECSSPFAFTTSPCEFTTKETVTSAYFSRFCSSPLGMACPIMCSNIH